MPDTLTPDPDYPMAMVIHPNILIGETPAGKRYQRVKGPPWREFELPYSERSAADRAAFDAFWAAHELAAILFDQSRSFGMARTWSVRFAEPYEYAFSRNDSHSWQVTLAETAPAAVAQSGNETDLIPYSPEYAVVLGRRRDVVALESEDRSEQRAARLTDGRRWQLHWAELDTGDFTTLEEFWLRRRDRTFTFAAPDTGANHVVLIDSEFRHVEVGAFRHTASFDVIEKI